MGIFNIRVEDLSIMAGNLESHEDGLSIRKAVVDDAEVLSQIICEHAYTILKPHYSEEHWNVFLKYYSPKVMAGKIERQMIYCAIEENTVVGCIGLDQDFVAGFYTRLNKRNQGIGKLLMNHIEMRARTNGWRALQLAASPEGLGFYYKNGWEKVRDIEIDHYGVQFYETLMLKNII